MRTNIFKTKYSVLYRSQDFIGNNEQVKSQEIKIDITPPEAKIYFDKDSQNLKIEGIDNLTSNPKVTSLLQDDSLSDSEFNDIKTDFQAEKDKDIKLPLFLKRGIEKKKITYQIKDDAGHTLTLTFKRIIDKRFFINAVLERLQYDNNSAIKLSKTTLNYFWLLDKKMNHLFQKLNVKNQFLVRAIYNQRKNQTKIIIKEKGEKKQKQILPGLVIIKLITKLGVLGWEF
jgi:hypothetical protein